MDKRIKTYNLLGAILVFAGLPLLFYALGDFPRRSILKEIISVLTLVSFSVMLSMFFMSRANKKVLNGHKMGKVNKLHKIIAYIFVGFLMIHPVLIVVPRYLEAGVEPVDAFLTIITSFGSTGIVLGIIAWSLMIILGLTSLLRNKLGIKYNTWRVFHGILSGIFISAALWHILNLGRHIDLAMGIFYCCTAALCMFLLLRLYFSNEKKL